MSLFHLSDSSASQLTKVSPVSSYIHALIRSKAAHGSFFSSPSLSDPGVLKTEKASYFSLGTRSAPSTPPDPSDTLWKSPASPATLNGTRSLFGRKKDKEEAKFPKELMTTIWDTLDKEKGDEVWKTTVTTFLTHLPNRKATKTMAGLNLREIPVLLKLFDSILPSGTSTKHKHALHFLAIVHSCVEQHYDPMKKKLKEGEKEMHVRITNELDSWSPRSEPIVESKPPVSPLTAGMLGSSSIDLGRQGALLLSRTLSTNTTKSISSHSFASTPPLSPSLSTYGSSRISLSSQSSGLRTPDGLDSSYEAQRRGGFATLGNASVDLVDVVRRVFGISKEKFDQDLGALKRLGLDEKVRDLV